MDISYQIILIGSLLLLSSILVTTLSSRIGMPILLVFLIIGILAGEQGPGKILFENLQRAHLIGVLALAIILLDAGLRTNVSSFRAGLFPALSLASIGIISTAILVGSFAAWLLDITWSEGLLLGAILSPTDAAAVFSLLYATHIKLKPRVVATLEIESGSNDPLAFLLTVSIIHWLQAEQSVPLMGMFGSFVLQMGLGALIGLAAGYLIVLLGNRLVLAESLYPLLVFASGMFIFAMANLLGGSGYLSIYLAGIVIGNNKIHQRKNILQLHDSLAWLSQIGMFVMLGLLVTVSDLFSSMLHALFIALMLIVIARPVAVWISLMPFKFKWNEKAFIAWTGLRGAVPVILAINPLLVGLKHASLFFNITFFVVVISIILQGWPLPMVAYWLKVKEN